MDLRLLREFSALVSAHSEAIVHSVIPMSQSALWNFWDQSRKQMSRWSTFLEKSSHPADAFSGSLQKQNWQQAEPILAEIFGLDMLARVWSTVLVASDSRGDLHHAAPVARSVMLGQRHLRHLCLGLMVNCSHESEARLANVDRFRRRIERWTDVLIGNVAAKYGVTEFAFDKKRVVEFGRDQLENSNSSTSSHFWKLISSGMQISFPESTSPQLADTSRVRDFVRAVIEGLPAELCHPGQPFARFLAEHVVEGAAGDEGDGDDVPAVLPLTTHRAIKPPILNYSEIRRRRP